MKRFEQITEAYAYAESGGQALHVWQPSSAQRQRAPLVFRRSEWWAHLIDYDKDRLVATGRRLGVRVIKVEREDIRGQHIDLCGAPLRRALECAAAVETRSEDERRAQ